MADRLGRSRNWAFVIYPDSWPDDWKEIITQFHVPAFVSPLHDRDKNPTGEEKKPHRHVLLMFEGAKSLNSVQAMIEPLHGTIPICVESLRGMARYFIHYDNPEKAQYLKEDMLCFSGAEFDQYLGDTPVQRHRTLAKMRKFIRDNGITSFAVFYDLCDEKYPEWACMLDDNSTMCISNYIKSRRYDKRDAENLDAMLRMAEEAASNRLLSVDPFSKDT